MRATYPAWASGGLGWCFHISRSGSPYGRAIRQRASCLIDAHGAEARAEALRAAEEPGMAAAGERSFWMAVAARVARQLGPGGGRAAGPLTAGRTR